MCRFYCLLCLLSSKHAILQRADTRPFLRTRSSFKRLLHSLQLVVLSPICGEHRWSDWTVLAYAFIKDGCLWRMLLPFRWKVMIWFWYSYLLPLIAAWYRREAFVQLDSEPVILTIFVLKGCVLARARISSYITLREVVYEWIWAPCYFICGAQSWHSFLKRYFWLHFCMAMWRIGNFLV